MFAQCAAALALIVGCASPGPPRAPSLRLPQRVTHLSAERHGNAVVLRFTTPQRTTDNQPLTEPVMASVCRSLAVGTCRPTTSFPGKVLISGPVELRDVLEPEFEAGAPRRLTYRVELFNPAGKSAGPSEPAFVAAGEAPHAVEGLRAEGSHGSVVLRWMAEPDSSGEVLVKREDLNAPPKKVEKKTVAAPKKQGGHKSHGTSPTANIGTAQNESLVWLHAADGTPGRDSGGMVDTTAKADEPYRYTAIRSRSVTLDGHTLEMRSEPTIVEMTLRDIYPPSIPQGLLVAGFPVQGSDGLAADLVWQPNTESDLAGYNVYRQEAGSSSAAVKLNAKPVALPSFHDATVVRGVGYRYTVTAVDAKGNESAASAVAELAATP